MKGFCLLSLSAGTMLLAVASAEAQIAPGTYIGSVEFQNLCSNGGQGSSAAPMRLTVSSKGVLSYLETTVYSNGTNGSGQSISQGGFAIIAVKPDGNWTAQNMLYGGGYNGYSTQGGTWSQTFTTNGNVVSASGTFNIIVNGSTVCTEPTSAVFIAAPKGY